MKMKKNKHTFEIALIVIVFAAMALTSAFNEPDIGEFIQQEIARVAMGF